MKKKILVAFIGIFAFSLLSFSFVQAQEVTDPRGATKSTEGKIVPSGYCFGILSQGARGPQVEDLQNILKSDPAIYPEGLTTGYYGPLTKRAVDKLNRNLIFVV